MGKIISINEARIDAETFRNYNAEALSILNAAADAAVEFKDLIDRVAKETKLKKGVVSKYFKARHAAKTQEAVKQGELFASLNSALDD